MKQKFVFSSLLWHIFKKNSFSTEEKNVGRNLILDFGIVWIIVVC